MISIIICSVNSVFLERLKSNIAETIGTPFEIIPVVNNIRNQSICAVYNGAAALAKYDCLCFVHEDVLFHNKDWGLGLLKLFADETIGLAGVSGTVYKSRYPGTWSACDPSLYRLQLVQHTTDASKQVQANDNPNKDCTEVAVVDGVFLATTRKVFAEYQFDENMLKGFHGYDIDFSLQVGSKYKVVVTHGVLLEHFSSGTLNKDWFDSSLLVHDKWKNVLPKNVLGTKTKATEISDYVANECLMNVALQCNEKLSFILPVYFRLIFGYFRFNKFKYTKTVISQLFGRAKTRNANV